MNVALMRAVFSAPAALFRSDHMTGVFHSARACLVA